jgi:ribonuclease HII
MLEATTIRIAGVDEAGRGPLAGPVVAAAVILDPYRPIDGLADSKKLSARRRETLAELIMNRALAVAVAVVEAAEIDRINILQATLLAMRQCVQSLDPEPQLVRVDGNRAPDIDFTVETLIGGDALEPAISAASIIAKTRRDAIMLKLHDHYPVYGFDRHKGYPTAAHLAALEEYGPCPVHRRSFRPVTQLGLF